MRDTVREIRHERANQTLEAHARDGQPFALMLRSYGARWTDGPRNLQQCVYEEISPLFGLLTIRGGDEHALVEETSDDPAVFNHCPALSLGDEQWFGVATSLVEMASFIVVEARIDSGGVSSELGLCRDLGRVDDTIVILPSPESEELFDPNTFENYWRLVLRTDFGVYSPFSHPSTRDIFRSILALRTAGQPAREWRLQPNPGGRRAPEMICDLVDLGHRYLVSGARQSSAIHHQNIWNIGVRMAAEDAPFFDGEVDALVRSGLALSTYLVGVARPSDARAKLEVCRILAGAAALEHYLPVIDRMESTITW